MSGSGTLEAASPALVSTTPISLTDRSHYNFRSVEPLFSKFFSNAAAELPALSTARCSSAIGATLTSLPNGAEISGDQ